MLTNTIIKKLKEGSIKNVFLFSDIEEYPEPPYVIVRPVASSGDRREIKIMAYHSRGRSNELSVYIMNEVNKLLGDEVHDTDGSRYKLVKNGYTDITAITDDNCYFMERSYLVPTLGME